MNIEKFRKLENREKQLKWLMEYWGIDDQYLIGMIYSENLKYKTIINIQPIGSNEILKDPFNEVEPLKINCINESNNYKLKYRDIVVFRFDINKVDNRYGIITTSSQYVSKLINTENIDEISKSDIIKQFKERKIYGNVNYVAQEFYIDEKLNEKIEEVENELASRRDKFEKDLLDKKEAGNNELKRLETKKKREIRKIEEVECILKAKIEEVNEIEKVRKTFEKYGFSFGGNNQEITVKGKSKISKDKHIEYIKNYLAFREIKQLYYSKEVLEQFYAGLCTNQLLILSGQPGTGKTSLVEGFCEAIAANLKIISVQPNWTDNQDLLGFFNPIEGTYISTPFLDGIIEAENNPEQLYIICLDEMNLAHVEYYFSEFLSKLQSQDKKITLYSEYLYKEAREEVIDKIEFYINKREEENSKIDENIKLVKNISVQDYYKLKKTWNSINRYKHEIKIPDNVRFVGTINKDETTKNLSPKVIDRSYIMEVDNYNRKLVSKILKTTATERKKYNENLYLKADEFSINNVNISKELEIKLNSIISILSKVNITLSNRIDNQIKELNGSGIFNECDIFDVIVATKILPKLNVEIDNGDEDIRKELEKNIESTSISKVIFEKMNKNSNESEMEILTFWR